MEELSDVVVTSMANADIPLLRSREQRIPRSALTAHGAFTRAERTVPGDDGGPDVPVVVYLPVPCPRPVPVILHLHGGGLVAGTADSDMPGVAELASQTGCAVVAVGYRLAPEHPYPAALDDTMAALRWLAGPDGPEQIDCNRIIVAGVSAGGGLAAATTLYARDSGGPLIAGTLLMCPMLDHRSNSFSARQMTGVGSWDGEANAVGWRAYLGHDESEDPVPWYASPAMCTDLSGLPPTFIDVGSAETFRNECVDYAERMWQVGGDAELHVWPGGAHGFDFLAPWAALSQAARAARTAWLRRLLSRI